LVEADFLVVQHFSSAFSHDPSAINVAD